MKTLNVYPKDSKILIIGPYPPPYGGVSVHVERLVKNLTKKEYNIGIFDTTINLKIKVTRFSKFFKLFKLLKFLIFGRYDIVHIQFLYRGYILIFPILRTIMGFKLYYTDHNPRLFQNLNKITLNIRKRFIKNLDYLMIVADHILEKYNDSNVKLPNNFLVQNAFLPPPLEEEDRVIQSYSMETKNFISNHKPLIVANAWKINFFKNTDIYGLDLCVKLTSLLKKKFPEIGLLFALANGHKNTDYIEKIKEQISKLGIKDNFHFMSGQKELWPLFRIADLSIRPTSTDGDAISIREALYFNCPVIASDVVWRPKGTITFKSRDINDLYFQVYKVLDSSLHKNF